MKKLYAVIILFVVGGFALYIFGPWTDIGQVEKQSQKQHQTQKKAEQMQERIQEEIKTYSLNGKSVFEEKFFMKNPLTGDLQRVHMFHSKPNAKNVPAVILVPGGGKSSSDFFQTALEGAVDFVMFTFDPLGRGESQGKENMHGKEDQAFLYEVYKCAKNDSNGSVSVASFSFGIAMVAGTLADYEMPISIWVEWEGPHERTFVAHLCMESREDMQGLSVKEKRRIRKEMLQRIQEGTAPGECADDEYWAEREAFYTVEEIEKNEIQSYHRLQGGNDHVHGNFCTVPSTADRKH